MVAGDRSSDDRRPQKASTAAVMLRSAVLLLLLIVLCLDFAVTHGGAFGQGQRFDAAGLFWLMMLSGN
jgi:hypothetical protein